MQKRYEQDIDNIPMPDWYAHWIVHIWWVDYNANSVEEFSELDRKFWKRFARLMDWNAQYAIYRHDNQ